ncbi:MAG: hypothetical protein AAB877_00415 [Patescibacteria group bacterium]
MQSSLRELIGGHWYDFAVFENEVVKIEPSGEVIEIILKGTEGRKDHSLHELIHPFSAFSDGFRQLFGVGCLKKTFSSDHVRFTFTISKEINVLAITCTNPRADPKPIKIEWH